MECLQRHRRNSWDRHRSCGSRGGSTSHRTCRLLWVEGRVGEVCRRKLCWVSVDRRCCVLNRRCWICFASCVVLPRALASWVLQSALGIHHSDGVSWLSKVRPFWGYLGTPVVEMTRSSDRTGSAPLRASILRRGDRPPDKVRDYSA